MMYATTPIAHMSAASVTSYDLEKASGGQLTHVPFIRCAAPFFTCVESPKSTSLSWPSRVKSKFSGLMSAWHSFCAWSSATAPASCWRSAAASFSEYAPAVARWSKSSPPSTYSITM